MLACWQNLCAELFLSRDDTEKVHDFEEECMEDFFREKENKFQSSSEERIRVINDRWVSGSAIRVWCEGGFYLPTSLYVACTFSCPIVWQSKLWGTLFYHVCVCAWVSMCVCECVSVFRVQTDVCSMCVCFVYKLTFAVCVCACTCTHMPAPVCVSCTNWRLLLFSWWLFFPSQSGNNVPSTGRRQHQRELLATVHPDHWLPPGALGRDCGQHPWNADTASIHDVSTVHPTP